MSVGIPITDKKNIMIKSFLLVGLRSAPNPHILTNNYEDYLNRADGLDRQIYLK